jgi:hypothetical protein
MTNEIKEEVLKEVEREIRFYRIKHELKELDKVYWENIAKHFWEKAIDLTQQKMIKEFKEMIDEKLRFMGTNWEMYNAIEILTALKSSLEGKGEGK